MKPNFALDFTHDGIRLLFRAAGGWSHVGEVALDDPKMSEHLKALRGVAEELGEGTVTTKLIIPDSQILYTTVEAPGPDDVAREVQIRVALEGMTPYSVSDLVFDWRAEGDVARVAVLANETMEEAEGFASQFGVNPVSFVARPDSGSFSGEPFFGKTKSASRILGGNERVTPDATPVPRNPRRMDLPGATPAPAAEPAPTAAAPATPDPAPARPAPQAAPPVTEPPKAEDPADQPAKATEPSVAESASAPSTPAPSAPATPAPARKPRPAAAPAVLAPFPPTPDDPSEISTKQTYKPIQRSTPAGETAPRKAPTPTRDAPATDEAANPAPAAPSVTAPATPDAPTPAFSSRRGAPTVPDTPAPATPPAPRPAVTAPVGVTEPRISDIDDSAAAPAKGDEAPASKPKPLVIDDTAPPLRSGLSGEAETRRQAMARAISAPTPKPGEEKPGLLSRVSTGISGMSSSAGARLRRPAKADTPAPLAPLPSDTADTPEAEVAEITPAVGKPAKEPKAKREKPKRARKEKPKDKELDARSKEAESLTVFGARRNQSTQRGRPRYMGLVLTLVLLLLMAAAALWSTVFLDDGDVTLFNPDPATTPAETTGANEVASSTTTAPTDPEPTPEPEVETGTVLSQEEAEAQYAVTGVYQRAPEPLGEPETARGDDVYVASIDPSISANDALALPDPGTVAEAPTDAPIPPPPPGTSFDLNENGLVIATPEGAVSPTGVIVFQGRPDLVPAPRPEGIVPETQDDAALALPGDTPGRSPEARPGNLAEITERAQLGGLSRDELAEFRPRARPEGLNAQTADQTEVAALDAAVDQAVDQAVAEAEETAETEEQSTDIENATELAVASSMRPGARPSNFSAMVEQAVQQAQNDEAAADEAEDHSDGNTVVAAAARSNQPIIPTSASVATTATMKNALPLGRVNLIGVYGSSSSRRALVRMGNGRYVKVSVGDRLDGGQVLAISDTRLVYQKGNRQFALDVLPLG
ncbi:MAG: hypothetical protein VX874_17075 [Pseudomonadota bacterium]|nr:hypothetical protein [Pseudomonadota bacterium]